MKFCIVVASVILVMNRGEGLKCLQCKGVSEPRSCNMVVDCYEGGSCSLKEVLNEFGDTAYNLGCMSDTVCNNYTNSTNGHRVTCSKCCNSDDLCNAKGCGPHDITDCVDVLRYGQNRGGGVYTVVTWKTHETMDVYCDMTTDGGGWLVFQNRFSGKVDFYRNFSQYENGFGNLNTEFWLGLKYIEEFANQGHTDIRIDLEAADGAKAYETFDNFSLSPGPAFTLHVGSTIDKLNISDYYRFGPSHNGYGFSTYDHDVDTYGDYNCAVHFHGAWWYFNCYTANLNGKYLIPGTYENGEGMRYVSFTSYSLKASKMMMRRRFDVKL